MWEDGISTGVDGHKISVDAAGILGGHAVSPIVLVQIKIDSLRVAIVAEEVVVADVSSQRVGRCIGTGYGRVVGGRSILRGRKREVAECGQVCRGGVVADRAVALRDRRPLGQCGAPRGGEVRRVV